MTKKHFYIFHFTFFFFVITSLFSCKNEKTKPGLPHLEAIEDDFFVNIKSEIGTRENPQARQDYWFNLLKDPATGQIPVDIKSRELTFARTLPRVADDLLRREKEDWLSVGPYNIGGRSRSALYDIANENVIITGGVSGGLWKSTDAGESWQKKNPIESIHSVTTIAQDTRPGKTNTWYYGTGEIQGNSARAPFAPFRGDGLFKSTDNGEAWTQLPSTGLGTSTEFNSQFQYVWKVITNPFNSIDDEVYAAIVGAIVKSTDGGNTWSLVLGEEFTTTDTLDLNQANISRFTDIELTEDGVFYAVLSSAALNDPYEGNGIFRSVNGDDWQEITPRNWPREFSRVVIASSKTSPDVLYFLGDNEDDDFLWRYQYLSGSGSGPGGSWTNLSENIPKLGGDLGDYDDQDSYNMVLKIHPADENIIYLGGTNLYRSDNGFTDNLNISWIGGYDSANDFTIFPNHYVDQHDLFFSYTNPDKMLSVNDGGIFQSVSNRSDDINWQPLNNGIITSQAYTIGFDPSTRQGKLIAGFQDNGTQISTNPDDNTRWTRFIGGDGAYCTVTKGEAYVYASFQESQIYRFTVNNSLDKTSFGRVDPIGGGEAENQGYLFVNPFALDPNNNNVMYLAGGNVVWRNINLAQIPSGAQHKTSINWQKIEGSEIDENQISSIAASTAPKNLVFYGTSFGKLFKIENSLSPQPVVTDITHDIFPNDSYLISIAPDRSDANNLLVAFSNYHVQSIFYSSDGGHSFEHVSGNLEEFEDGTGSGPSVRWVDIFPKRDGSYIYFAATSTGLYSTETLDGENTIWLQEGNSTIGNVVGVMVRHRQADGSVFFATHGSGIFQSYFDDPADPASQEPDNRFNLIKTYPNPFNNEVNVSFSIPREGPVKISVLNLAAQKVKTLLWAHMYAGENFITWDGTNSVGGRVIPGVYLINIEYGGTLLTQKVIFKG